MIMIPWFMHLPTGSSVPAFRYLETDARLFTVLGLIDTRQERNTWLVIWIILHEQTCR
jgi:hypothetical protein